MPRAPSFAAGVAPFGVAAPAAPGSPGVVGSPAASVSSVTRELYAAASERYLIVARVPAERSDARADRHSPG